MKPDYGAEDFNKSSSVVVVLLKPRDTILRPYIDRNRGSWQAERRDFEEDILAFLATKAGQGSGCRRISARQREGLAPGHWAGSLTDKPGGNTRSSLC
jgi:hypothetical protein